MSKSSAVIWNFRNSQNSVATQFRWGGRPCNISSRVSLDMCQWKKFENRSTFAEVLIKSQVYCFLDTVYIYRPIIYRPGCA